MVRPLWKTASMEVSQKFKKLSRDSAISLLGIYSSEMKSVSQRDSYSLVFTAAFFIVAKIQKQAKCVGEGNGNPLQCSCLENPRDRRTRWAAVYGVAQSWTRLK